MSAEFGMTIIPSLAKIPAPSMAVPVFEVVDMVKYVLCNIQAYGAEYYFRILVGASWQRGSMKEQGREAMCRFALSSSALQYRG